MSQTANIEVVIIAHKAIVREGLRRILADRGFNVRAAVPDHADIVESPDQASPQLIIIDTTTVDEGIDMCSMLRAAFPDARLVIMADEYDLATISRAFAVGIDGYLVKEISSEPLIGALNLIVLGEKVVPSQTVASLTDPHPVPDMGGWLSSRVGVNLSDREVEILRRLVNGEANKLISRRLMITEATVKVHVKAILRKLHVLNRTQAAIWAVNRGLTGAPPTPESPFSGAVGKGDLPPPAMVTKPSYEMAVC